MIGDEIEGLSASMLERYITYLGELRWHALGLGDEAAPRVPDDMAWVLQHADPNMVKTDFFEARSTAYAKATALVDDL